MDQIIGIWMLAESYRAEICVKKMKEKPALAEGQPEGGGSTAGRKAQVLAGGGIRSAAGFGLSFC